MIPPGGEDPDPNDGWDAGWEGHARAQRRRIAALPLWMRIDWLEETQRMVTTLRRGQGGSDEADGE
jgi:hypothetical protein